MIKVVMAILALIILLAYIVLENLKKAYLYQYFNIKNGRPKGSLLEGILHTSLKKQDIWKILDEQINFSLTKSMETDNEVPELRPLRLSIRKIRYLKYILLFSVLMIALIAAMLNKNGFSIWNKI